MTSITRHHPLTAHGFLAVTRSRFFALVEARRTYRRKRAVYLRTLRELDSYRPHELQDIGIQSGDIERLARQEAGW